MTKPVHLLVATDLTALSRHAAHRAAMLAQQTQATLELLHVLETPALAELRRLLGSSEADMEQRVETQGREAMQQLADEIEQQHGIHAHWHVTPGRVPGAILEQADRSDAGMLVVGASSAAMLRQWLLGATADRLLRASTRPILFVRQPPYEPYRRVLVPVDFSPCAAAALAHARAIAPAAQVLLMHVCALAYEGKMRFAGVADTTVMQYRQQSRRDAQAQLQSLADAAGLASPQWTGVVTQGDPGRDILTQQVELDADLIVLGKQGADTTRELLLGSVTQQVLGQAHCDLLVTPC
ncbi:universal stress protein [Comamonadaceae bacterium G21597-S1]|nr:universal stress protein [Comamonadaceae bacterium G21597-S1]